MNRKKFYAIIVAFVVYSIMLFVISARYRDNNTGKNNAEQSRIDDEAPTGNLSYETSDNESIKWNDFEVVIDGDETTEDNPYGFTAGVFEDTSLGNCILLTPNTGFTIRDLEQTGYVHLQSKLHPWVAESSDGIGIDVWVLDKDGNILQQKSLIINKGDDWVDIECDLRTIKQATQLRFLCNNGENDDDSADWAVFRKIDDYYSDFGKEGYVRSATYYGREWPMNFWNSEFETLEQDFKRISDDGFNSIIICIPWKEFQTSVSPIEYNDYPFEHLDKVMRTADKYNLDVYARIGYTWDYYNDGNENITERYLDILRTDETHDAWLDYCRVMYETLSGYQNFKDAFLVWEDFWGCLSICDNSDIKVRRQYAKSIGYTNWLKDNYTLNEYNKTYGVWYFSFKRVPVPQRTEPAMEAFYKFYDDYLNNILDETQSMFPNISLEVRLDSDLLTNAEGEQNYYSHSDTYRCGKSDYTAVMYGIPMGFENQGEHVSADEAIEKTEYILGNLLTFNSAKPVYVEQFLFTDNTPKFSLNAKLPENEVGKYLENVIGVLVDYTRGYGIWTYRDYKNNMLYNCNFGLGERGWDVSGTPTFGESKELDSMVCNLSENDSISQSIPAVRNHFPSETYIFEFEVIGTDGAILQATLGNTSKQIEVKKNGVYSIEISLKDTLDFQLKGVSGNVVIDNLCLYSFVQEGHLYNVDNEEMEYISSIRSLNQKLKEEN